MEDILVLDGLSKLYKNGRGAQKVSFKINSGDIVGILGPNGSGKTTIMKAILGMTEITGGSVEIFGINAEENHEEAMKNVGYLVEAPALYNYLSAYNNLKIMSRLYDNVDKERIEKVLEIVNLKRYQMDKVKRFSLGMRQRLGIAMAILSEPKLLVLDEPTNGIDIEGVIRIREVIKKLSERGCACLISGHNAAELEKICNKIVVMHEGEMLSFETTEEALKFQPSLEDYYLEQVKEKRGAVIV